MLDEGDGTVEDLARRLEFLVRVRGARVRLLVAGVELRREKRVFFSRATTGGATGCGAEAASMRRLIPDILGGSSEPDTIDAA